MASIVRLLAVALAWTGAAALLPAFASLRLGEGLAPAFLATTLGCVFLAGAMRFSSAGLGGRVRRFDVFAALAGLWLIVPAAATPVIAYASGLPLGAAFFEGLSAFTTTGFTALNDAPRSLYVWLGVLQFSGGLLTIVSGLAVLAPAGIAGLPDRAVHRLEERDAIDTFEIVKDVAPVYLAGFLFAFVALLIAGNAPYVAFTLSTAATSAGAHVPPEARDALAAGGATRWLLLPILLWAATSVRWHKAVTSRRINAAPEQGESLLLIGFALLAGLVLSVMAFDRVPGTPVSDALSEGMMAAASLLATSGLEPAPGLFAALPHGVLLTLALCGGGALSVAGGLKMFRLRALVARSQADLTRLVSPNIVQPARTGEIGVGSAMRGVWVGTVALFATIAVSLLALAAGAPTFEAALAGAVAATTNTGPLYDAVGLGPPISSYPAVSMIGAGFAMIAGRIEIVGAFVLIHLAFWRA